MSRLITPNILSLIGKYHNISFSPFLYSRSDLRARTARLHPRRVWLQARRPPYAQLQRARTPWPAVCMHATHRSYPPTSSALFPPLPPFGGAACLHIAASPPPAQMHQHGSPRRCRSRGAPRCARRRRSSRCRARAPPPTHSPARAPPRPAARPAARSGSTRAPWRVSTTSARPPRGGQGCIVRAPPAAAAGMFAALGFCKWSSVSTARKLPAGIADLAHGGAQHEAPSGRALYPDPAPRARSPSTCA